MIHFKISQPQRISFALAQPDAIPFELKQHIAIGAEYYEGDYIVDPEFNEQTLATREKRMHDDVTVNPIQVERTDNPQGGTTVYIGGMLYG